MVVWCCVSLLLITIVTPCDSSLKNYLAYTGGEKGIMSLLCHMEIVYGKS